MNRLLSVQTKTCTTSKNIHKYTVTKNVNLSDLFSVQKALSIYVDLHLKLFLNDLCVLCYFEIHYIKLRKSA